MVALGKCFALICLAVLLLSNVHITVEMDEQKNGADRPVSGIIKVIRDSDTSIDESSFCIDGTPLKTTLVQESQQSSLSIVNNRRKEYNYLTSLYRFTLPAQPQGRHILKPISVKVGEKTYYTKSLQYVLNEAHVSRDVRLTLHYEGPQAPYPGQKGKFIYRIIMPENFEPTYENFPLLQPDGFKKMGEKEIRQYRQGTVYVREISQEVQAEIPGEYAFSESYLEGMLYSSDLFGYRTYRQPKIKTTAPPMQITIRAFPAEGKKASFNGAVGNYTIHARLLNANTVFMGDKLELEIKITGKGVDSVQLPLISLQEGFKRAFRSSDLPPIGRIVGSQKIFVYELRPMSNYITEIPPIEFTFFDPEKGCYQTLSTSSIPITVQALQLPPIQKSSDNASEQEDNISDTSHINMRSYSPGDIEIAGNYPIMQQKIIPMWPWYLLLPLGACCIVLQIILKRFLAQAKSHVNSSMYLIEQLLQGTVSVDKTYALLEKAFLLRLFERGHTTVVYNQIQDVPDGKVFTPIKCILAECEEILYARNQSGMLDQYFIRAKKIYDEI